MTLTPKLSSFFLTSRFLDHLTPIIVDSLFLHLPHFPHRPYLSTSAHLTPPPTTPGFTMPPPSAFSFSKLLHFPSPTHPTSISSTQIPLLHLRLTCPPRPFTFLAHLNSPLHLFTSAHLTHLLKSSFTGVILILSLISLSLSPYLYPPSWSESLIVLDKYHGGHKEGGPIFEEQYRKWGGSSPGLTQGVGAFESHPGEGVIRSVWKRT